MRRVTLAAVALGLVFACGCAGNDLLLGSWKPVDAGGDGYGLVIAKSDAGYKVAFDGAEGLQGWTPLRRQGRSLLGTMDSGDGPLAANLEVRLTFIWDNGRLRYADNDGLEFTLYKVSDSTVEPSPSE